jgi:hypothetical protein
MAIALDTADRIAFSQDRLSGASRAHAIDRWIYVFTAAIMIAIVLAGFVPDSVTKVAAIQAGKRPPFPIMLHVHAVLMGSFLLLLLAQTVLVATGRRYWHMQLGIAAAVLVPAIIITGFVIVPQGYHIAWQAAQVAPMAAQPEFEARLSRMDNVQLIQFRMGLLFLVLMWIALRSRTRDPGLHKRLVFLAIAATFPAPIDRIHWLPTTFPNSMLATDLYMVLVFSPMLVWDLIRNRALHRAYLIWAALFIPASAVVYSLWDTAVWHDTARRIMGL